MATSDKFSGKCCRCCSSVGDDVRVQPVRADDGCGKYETHCPRCFVWWRMNQTSEQGTHGQPRFNASQACVAKCQFCEWVAISFGAQPGQQLRCNVCGKPGAIPLRVDHTAYTKQEMEAIMDIRSDMAKGLLD